MREKNTRNVRRKHGYILLAIHRIGKFTHCIWLMFMIYVGKYDSIMDPLDKGLCEELSSDQNLYIGDYIWGFFHKPWNQNPFIFTNRVDSSCQGSMFFRCSWGRIWNLLHSANVRCWQLPWEVLLLDYDIMEVTWDEKSGFKDVMWGSD